MLEKLFRKPKPKESQVCHVDLHEQVLEVAKSQLGVHEQGGNNHGPEIKNYLKEVGLDEGNPWCAAFVIWCIHQVELKHKKVSGVFKTGHVLTMWNHSPMMLRENSPKPGYLALWRHGDTLSGHIGIVEKVNDDGRSFISIEGNTRPGHKAIVREGDSVQRLERSLDHSDTFTLLGFLKVF